VTERALLEVDGIGIQFGKLALLKTAAFSARSGRITTLMGRNGVGKTTLLRAAIGKVRPQWGRVLFDGEYLPRPTLASLARRGLMYISQESSLAGLFTVEEHLQAFVQAYGGAEMLPALSQEMALEPLFPSPPHELSGGEKKRVALAMALLRRPRCLLMDEPFASVAPMDRALVARGLRSLRDQGAAIVISGHDVEDLFAIADDVIWVMGGTTHWLGTPAEAAQNHEFRKVYLGPQWYRAPSGT
jgi:lipopolysaccharide export system ATP-binding protein